jgi:hypothetical protein
LQARWKIYHLLQSKLVDHQFSGNSFSIQGWYLFNYSGDKGSILKWFYRKDFNQLCMAHTYLPILYDNVKLGNLKLPVKLPPASTHSWWFRVPICQSPVLSVVPNICRALNKRVYHTPSCSRRWACSRKSLCNEWWNELSMLHHARHLHKHN